MNKFIRPLINYCLLAVSSAACISTPLTGADTGSAITITISGITAIKGNLRVGLYLPEDDFLKEKGLKGITLPHTAKVQDIHFDHIPNGVYAIAVYQDINKNNRLDKNQLGIPLEPFGFSNNPPIGFGPPSFEQCRFEVTGNKVVQIEMRNLFRTKM